MIYLKVICYWAIHDWGAQKDYLIEIQLQNRNLMKFYNIFCITIIVDCCMPIINFFHVKLIIYLMQYKCIFECFKIIVLISCLNSRLFFKE